MQRINTTSALWNMPRKIQFSEKPPRVPVEILELRDRGDDVVSIRLSKPACDWHPGDCIAVYAAGDSGISRPYSLSSGLSDPYWEVWVRRFPGGCVSSYLCDRRAGDRIEISPPFGWFRPAEPVAADKLYFATGTGIAPFLSAMRSGVPAPRGLFWGMRQPLVLSDFTGERFLSQSTAPGYQSGRFTRILPGIEIRPDSHIYACGLDRMIEEVMAYFSGQGIPDAQLHRECFFTASVCKGPTG